LDCRIANGVNGTRVKLADIENAGFEAEREEEDGLLLLRLC